MTRNEVRFVFRGRTMRVVPASPYATLLDWLRLDARATGTKEGCGEGDCGACTLALGRFENGRLVYRPVNACILLLAQADGAEIVTIEDLADAGALHPIQQALVKHHGSQCGFCTPGIVMSLFALLESRAAVTRARICDALAGNLCRCTGYKPIIDAALEAAGILRTRFSEDAGRQAAIKALQDEADVFIGDDTGFIAAPADEDGLAALYASHPDAVLVSGATDVGLWITKALMAPQKVIWLGRARGLSGISGGTGGLSLGATASLADTSEHLSALHPDLGEVMRRFGSAQVRASGTIGGNIANGSPIGDLAPCLIALGATIELRRGKDVRTLPIEKFFLAYRKQDRQPGEYVRAIHIPALPTGASFHAFKVSKRFDEDISAVLGAFLFEAKEGRIVSARIGFGGMAGVPARAAQTEAACSGLPLHDETAWQAAFDALAGELHPISDMRASASYRAIVARNLLRKALLEARGEPRISLAASGARHAAE